MTQTPDTPLEDLTGRASDPPMNTQFSVFLDNRVGKLLELVEIFDGQPLRLAALSVVDSTDHAVVRVITTDADLAAKTLKKHHLPFTETNVLVVGLRRNHRLTKLSLSLLSAEVNIAFAYPLLVRPHGMPAVALHTDDEYVAGEVLRRKEFVLLSEGDLSQDAGGAPPP